MISAPIRYRPDVEDVKPDEAETIEQLCNTFDVILERTAEDGGHAVRSVHAKSHGILEGTLTIDSDLAPELAQGLFAKPGRHKIIMRMSTNAGDILPDTISLPRGLAMKVLDVEGERLPEAEGTSQDFIMVNGKVFQAKSADAFEKNLKLLAKTTDRLEGLKVATSTVLRGVNKALTAVGAPSTTLGSLGGAPNVDPLGETYFSLTPFRYGDFIAKFSVKPVAPALTALTGQEIEASREHPNAIRETVQREMAGIDGQWEFRVQLCRDLDKQPVEDPTVEWNEEEAPFQRVGIIDAGPQDSWAADKVQAVDEEMRFAVWTGLAAHRPLGNINRARKAPYRHSASFRERFNKMPDPRNRRPGMILFDHPLSSYAQKVKIALREKGIAFERMLPEDFGTGRRDTAFAVANPRTEVPVLLPDGEAPIFDSTIILEYIEERWPEPSLLPAKPMARAQARMTEDVCDTQYEAVNWGFGEVLWFRRAEGPVAETLRAAAARDTAALQDWLSGRLGNEDWFGGEGFGWVDAAVAPMVNRSVHYGLGPEPTSSLALWHARLRERPAVAETFDEFDQAAAKMTAASDFYRTGGRRREYRDHRLEWMIRSGGIDVVLAGMRDDTIRFSWPG